jgi:hypothetical protein
MKKKGNYTRIIPAINRGGELYLALHTSQSPSNDELLKKNDIQKIAVAGKKIYEKIKTQYDPKDRGRFLAIEIESEDAYLGDTSALAVESARHAHPNKMFYVLKIGYDVAETMARAFARM